MNQAEKQAKKQAENQADIAALSAEPNQLIVGLISLATAPYPRADLRPTDDGGQTARVRRIGTLMGH